MFITDTSYIFLKIKKMQYLNDQLLSLSYAVTDDPGFSIPGSVFTNHSQEHSLSLSPRIANLNVTQLLIG